MTGNRLPAMLAVLLALGFPAASAVGQGPSPYLPADHWAVQAAWRAEAAGLVDFHPAQRLVSATVVARALRGAASAAEGRPGLEPLTEGWLERFVQEYPGLEGGDSARAIVQGVSFSAGYEGNLGTAGPGVGIVPPLRSGAADREDRSGLAADASLALQVGSRLSLHLSPALTPGNLDLAVADLTVALGSWTASVGRQAVGYGWAEGGQVVLSGATQFDRAEVATRRPLSLPLWLRHLGPTTFHSFLTRLPEPRHAGEPYLWGARFAVQPHPRVSLAVHRASQFGGEGAGLPINARNVFNMLLGSLEGGAFENQIVSMSGRFRLPTERLLPLTVRLEWGAEDAAGAWSDVPARVFGLDVPMIPGIPELAIGAEVATFKQSCCGNPPWYRHGAFVGGWATDERPLGHPMGGNGTEAGLHALLDLGRSGHRLRGRAFVRDRGPENLFFPQRDRSFGFVADMASRVRPGFDVFWSLAREAGAGWADESISIGGRAFPAISR